MLIQSIQIHSKVINLCTSTHIKKVAQCANSSRQPETQLIKETIKIESNYNQASEEKKYNMDDWKFQHRQLQFKHRRCNKQSQAHCQPIILIGKIESTIINHLKKKNTTWMIGNFNTDNFNLNTDDATNSLKLTANLSYCIKTIIQNNS